MGGARGGSSRERPMNEGVTMSRAGPDDVARLVELMTEFYPKPAFR